MEYEKKMELKVGDVIWQMVGTELNGTVTYHAVPHCVEIVDDRMVRFENGCGGSKTCIGKMWFLSRDEAIADFIKRHGRLELPEEDCKELEQFIQHKERTDFQTLEVVEFDSVDSTAVYLGGVSCLKKVNDELNWHEEEVESLDMNIKSLTLTEIYEQLKEVYGCQIITVFVDSPMHGEIYQCGNYEDGKWVKLGSTMGYA